MRNSRIILKGLASGVLVAAMSSFLSTAIYIKLIVGFKESKGFLEALLVVGSVAFAVSFFVSFVFGVLVGLPMFYFSIRMHKTTLVFYIIGGYLIAVLAIAIASALSFYIFPQLFLHYHLFLFSVGALIGAPAATAAFWAVVRPDKMKPQ
jgi:hypothetical protein